MAEESGGERGDEGADGEDPDRDDSPDAVDEPASSSGDQDRDTDVADSTERAPAERESGEDGTGSESAGAGADQREGDEATDATGETARAGDDGEGTDASSDAADGDDGDAGGHGDDEDADDQDEEPSAADTYPDPDEKHPSVAHRDRLRESEESHPAVDGPDDAADGEDAGDGKDVGEPTVDAEPREKRPSRANRERLREQGELPEDYGGADATEGEGGDAGDGPSGPESNPAAPEGQYTVATGDDESEVEGPREDGQAPARGAGTGEVDDTELPDGRQVDRSPGDPGASYHEAGGADAETPSPEPPTVEERAPDAAETTAPAGGTATTVGEGPSAGGGLFGSGGGPEADQEMPLTEHIEEMLKRLAVVVLAVCVVTVVVFPFGEEVIQFLWASALPGENVPSPHLYSPPELLITQVKVASLAGIILALPVLVYESYLFMRPGLFPHERRYYLAAVPTSLVLAFVGVTFAHFIVVPTVFIYFLHYTETNAEIAFALGQTFDLILVLMGYLAIVFQIPLFVMLAIMMGLVTRRWLAARRLLFWGGFLGISFLFSPDPTGMSPIIIAVTMIVLFEGTLLLVKWTGRG